LGRIGQWAGSLLHRTTVAQALERRPEQREVIRQQLLANNLVRDSLLSTQDPTTFAVLIQASGEAAAGHRRKTIVAALRAAVDRARVSHPDREIILAGPLVTMIDIFRYLHRDLVVFAVLVTLLIGAVLFGIFRRTAVLVMALFAAWGGTVATLGLAAALQIPASLIIDMIVILVSIVSVAMCVHLIVAHEEVCLDMPSADRRARAAEVLRRAGTPCVFVALTTGVGFGSLWISNLAPVRNFAMLMQFGILLSLVLPTAAVVLMPPPRGADPRSTTTGTTRHWLQRVVAGSCRRPRRVLVAFAAGSAIVGLGVHRLTFESDFVKNFRAGSEVRRSYAFVQAHLAPVASLELVLTSDRTLLRPDVIQAAHQLAGDVVTQCDLVNKGLSLADLLTLGGLPAPTNDADLSLRLAALRHLGQDRALRNFVSADRTHLRVNFRVREAGSVAAKLATAETIAKMARETLPPDVHIEVTGLYAFYANLIDGLLRDQFRTFALAAAGIFAVMILATRSVRTAAVSMIPNLLPMLLTFGLMGWLGIGINMAMAMMLSVSLGIAVDNTIHYLWRVDTELRTGADYPVALQRAHGTVGRACVFSAVVIAGGFWILCFSEFLPTAYFGAMVGVTMLCALAADLVLLPALLVVLRPITRSPPNRR
jgi:hypothetical protein